MEEKNIRNTKRWKKLYEDNLQTISAMRGSKEVKQEAYLKMIDKLASQPITNQNNIMSGFNLFAGSNFKWKSDDEDKK